MLFSKRIPFRKPSEAVGVSETEAIPFPEAWFALATSASLKLRAHRPIRFLDKDWVLFRDERGRAGLVARYCSHMGADLAQGCVRDRNLVCPLHQWGFSSEGACNSDITPGLSESTILASLTVQEWAGIIFVFPAPSAAYGLPRKFVPAFARFSRVRRVPCPFHWLLPSLNTFDISHFSHIHHREFVGAPQITSESPDRLAIRFTARVLAHRLRDRIFLALGFGCFEVSIECWGGVLLVMRNHTTGVGAVIGVTPIGPCASELYLSTFNLAEPKGLLARMLTGLKLELGRIATLAFLQADVPALKGMRLHAGVLIPGKDDGVIRFWKFFHGLPKVGV